MNIALVPSYEPDEHLLEVVQSLTSAGFELVVVNDGSSSEFQPRFDEIKDLVQLVSYPDNRGKGMALKEGMRFIREHYDGDCFVVCVDSDGQHSAKDALACVSAAREHRGALVLGVRDFNASDVPLRSRLGNKITRLIFRLSTGVALSDTQTGLRAFSYDMIDELLAISGGRYEWEMNVLFACADRGSEIIEVPIETIYENNNEVSHFHPLHDSILIYRSIFEFLGSSLASFVVDYLLYSLLVGVLARFGQAGTLASNVIARLVSATVNYSLNRNLVFKSAEGVVQTLWRYIALAAGILVANTAILHLLTAVLHIGPLPAKLITELLLFSVSWVVQHRVVFKRKSY